jgi:hypothetical protein
MGGFLDEWFDDEQDRKVAEKFGRMFSHFPLLFHKNKWEKWKVMTDD